jgi:hypothetical protein
MRPFETSIVRRLGIGRVSAAADLAAGKSVKVTYTVVEGKVTIAAEKAAPAKAEKKEPKKDEKKQ